MSFIISGQDAYDIYEHLGLRKAKKKSASYETVETILKSKNVEIKPKPSDPVSLNLKKNWSTNSFWSSAAAASLPLLVQRALRGSEPEETADYYKN